MITDSAAEYAISKYEQNSINRPSDIQCLNCPSLGSVDGEERKHEIETLCNFLRGGSIRKDSQVAIILEGNFSNDEAKKLFDAMIGLPVFDLRIAVKDMNADSIENLGLVISNSKMEYLNLSRSSFAENGSAELGRILPSCQSLSSLGLGNTNFDSSGAQGLLSLIDSSQNLRDLNLSDSKFGNGIKDLWQAISRSPNISSVNLKNSGIDSKGIAGMADAILSTNKKFRQMELSGNQVGDEGCMEIVSIIAENRLIRNRELDLSDMGIGDIGVNAIADASVDNQNITKLHLFLNPKITNQGISEAIEKFKQINFTLDYEFINKIEDAVTDYSKSVLAPKLVGALFKNEGREIILSDKVIKSLNQVTQKQLFENLTSAQILEFSEHWHQPLQQVKSNDSKDFGKESWSLLFGEDKKEIDVMLEGMEGWKLVTRNNSGELKKEGSDLSHCVGTYVGKCFKGSSHIVSVVNPEGDAVSTIEIEADYSRRSFKQIQHMGRRNNSISQESKCAEDWLYKEIEEGRISINYDALAASKLAREQDAAAKRGGQAKMVIGFDPLNGDKVRRVRRVFKEMLPAGNQQLEDNFSSLVSLEEIQIAGEKYNLRALPKATKADLTQEKDKKFSDEMAAIVTKIQESLNVIFGEGALQASISLPPEGKKTKKNQFGQVVLKGENLLEGNLLDKIKEIFDGEVSDDGYVINSKITPKKVMVELKNHLTNSQSNEEKKPSGRVSPVSEEKLAGEEQDLGRGG